jgi:uncharacterized protein YbaA (DUF1428 family)
MAAYVDGFVLPVPKKNLAAYRKMARLAGKIYRELGAVSYSESVADDVKPGKWTSFPQSVKLKAGETVVFSYVVYKSRTATHQQDVHAGPAAEEVHGPEENALRRQAHVLGRLQDIRYALRPAGYAPEAQQRGSIVPCIVSPAVLTRDPPAR